jgi:hypothetical protein
LEEGCLCFLLILPSGSGLALVFLQASRWAMSAWRNGYVRLQL